jgi:hypothetical protein
MDKFLDQFQPMPPVSILAENVSTVNPTSGNMVPSAGAINTQWARHAAIHFHSQALGQPILSLETRPL